MGPTAVLEDTLEAVQRVLHFEYARPLRALLRKHLPAGCTRITTRTLCQALKALSSHRGGLLTEKQIQCLVDSMDVTKTPMETEGHFDFEDYSASFQIVDTLRIDPSEAAV